jgi:hypothetical protein
MNHRTDARFGYSRQPTTESTSKERWKAPKMLVVSSARQARRIATKWPWPYGPLAAVSQAVLGRVEGSGRHAGTSEVPHRHVRHAASDEERNSAVALKGLSGAGQGVKGLWDALQSPFIASGSDAVRVRGAR